MRLSLKLLIALFITISTFYLLPYDHIKKTERIESHLKNYLGSFGIDNYALKKESKDIYKKFGSKYLLIERIYEVPPDFPFYAFREELKSILEREGFLLIERGGLPSDAEYSVLFKKMPLYNIKLIKKDKGCLVIVLDDFGYSNKTLHYLKEIELPLNISILPNLQYSKSISLIAKKSGHEVLLHLPMEPVKSKKIEKHLEKFTIKSTTSDENIIEELNGFLNELRDVKGANNHMGSSLCRDKEKMTTILKILKERGLYFLDSRVVSDSKSLEVAKELNLKCFQRDVFIDNIEDSGYIKKQIREAIRLAKRKGFAIAIGHDRETTLKTILSMLAEIKESTYPVKLSELR
ncbi:MAG: divergent polysaccharide deacetylase family protein [Candidatus Kaelpia aquatica]|nr:divergent polysaccharide deacetylase family protein [Candidatus Kaelpia aquatica]